LKGDHGKPYHEMQTSLSALASAAKNHNAAEIKKVLQKLIPEYTPDEEAVPVIDFRQPETDGVV